MQINSNRVLKLTLQLIVSSLACNTLIKKHYPVVRIAIESTVVNGRLVKKLNIIVMCMGSN